MTYIRGLTVFLALRKKLAILCNGTGLHLVDMAAFRKGNRLPFLWHSVWFHSTVMVDEKCHTIRKIYYFVTATATFFQWFSVWFHWTVIVDKMCHAIQTICISYLAAKKLPKIDPRPGPPGPSDSRRLEDDESHTNTGCCKWSQSGTRTSPRQPRPGRPTLATIHSSVLTPGCIYGNYFGKHGLQALRTPWDPVLLQVWSKNTMLMA